MFLWRLFLTAPMMAIALCVCLATSFWCIVILRKRQKGPDRFLAALIGLISIAQGFRLLTDRGLITVPAPREFTAFADLVVTAMYLIAVLILRSSANERKNTQVRLRLSEANSRAHVTHGLNLAGPVRPG